VTEPPEFAPARLRTDAEDRDLAVARKIRDRAVLNRLRATVTDPDVVARGTATAAHFIEGQP
jgi:hypothetical protein